MFARLVGLFVLLSLATAGSAQTLTWTKLSPTTSPSTRLVFGTAYDASRGVVVLFGGESTSKQPMDETWEFDGANWKRIITKTSPSRRDVYGLMAYDSKNKRIVLFGGWSGGSDLSDTWAYDGNNWTKLSPKTSPPARSNGAMAYDSARGVVVLFGGWSQNFHRGDTWEFDGGNWKQVTTKTAPTKRNRSNLVYDACRKTMVLFGGSDSTGPVGDTWEYDGAEWTLQKPKTSPPARFEHGMAFDGSRIVLFGGYYAKGTTEYPMADTWTFDGTDWQRETLVTNPSARGWCGFVHDDRRSQFVLFGGRSSSEVKTWLNDTWTLVRPPHSPRLWSQARPLASPSARTLSAMAFDSDRERTILFGGWLGDKRAFLGDTWQWNGHSWKKLAPKGSPPARGGHMMAYDSDREVVVLFGGAGASNKHFNDTWEWSGANWTRITPKGTPPSARDFAGMAYDSDRKRIVLFGGHEANNSYLADTWEWDGMTWSRRATTGPGKRALTALAYDSHRRKTVLFGGTPGTGAYSDLWEWNGSKWTAVPTTKGPSARGGHAMAYDPRRKALVVSGGVRWPKTFHPAETWEWNGTWSKATGVMPAARWGAAMALNSNDGSMVLFGGAKDFSSRTVFRDTWVYGVTFGTGCAGDYRAPALTAPTPPRIGRQFTLNISNLKPVTSGLLVLGGSNTTWNGSQLPLDLAFMNMKGCQLLVSWDVTIGIFSQAGGTLQWTPTIPNEKGLVGRTVFAQAWVLDAAANPLGIATSNGAKALIGN